MDFLPASHFGFTQNGTKADSVTAFDDFSYAGGAAR
jgi:hypothetical protein